MQRQGLESIYLSNCNKLNKVLKLWHTDKPLLLYRCGYSQLIFKIMAKCRIIERTNVDGRKEYVIQQKHFLFRWWWVDAWINSSCGAACQDSFSTLEEAQKNLCYFDNSKCVERVVS